MRNDLLGGTIMMKQDIEKVLVSEEEITRENKGIIVPINRRVSG